MKSIDRSALRSRQWFGDHGAPDMTALYLERYMNFGLTLEELRSGRPIIGIAQTGSDLNPCNRHHLVLAERLRDGIRESGGVPLEFSVHPIHENAKRPTAGLDRNLMYLSLVEVLFGYPIDGVVLMIGCDKTTPACLMAAATVNIPSIALSVGPMLNGWYQGKRVGSGTVVWKAREMYARRELDSDELIKMVASAAPSTGFCNAMGTALTMNCIVEGIGLSLPGSAAIPAPYRDRQENAYWTGKQIVEMVEADRKPSDIVTRASLVNAIRLNSALGGSTNAPIHLAAVARHMNIPLEIDDWQKYGRDVPLLVNLQPAGEYLAEDFYRAGGVPAVLAELHTAGLIDGSVLTSNGRTLEENCSGCSIIDAEVIRPMKNPLVDAAGFTVLKGNLFDSAIMKMSAVSDVFRQNYLRNPDDPNSFEGKAIVFDGPEDYRNNIDRRTHEIDHRCILIMRGCGPVGYPGAAEVVNMQPPAALIMAGTTMLPCIGDGRQSGTSGSPSILNASPEAAVGGGLAILKTGDIIRIDLNLGTANVLLDDKELISRRAALDAAGGYPIPESQTPWQEIQRAHVGQLRNGATLEIAVKYQRLAQKYAAPRHNH